MIKSMINLSTKDLPKSIFNLDINMPLFKNCERLFLLCTIFEYSLRKEMK